MIKTVKREALKGELRDAGCEMRVARCEFLRFMLNASRVLTLHEIREKEEP
jgi:hypothetical protein